MQHIEACSTHLCKLHRDASCNMDLNIREMAVNVVVC
jgi:hypothetical protein